MLRLFEVTVLSVSFYGLKGHEKGGGFINGKKQLELYIDQYQNLIFSVCYKYTENYFDAEDLTQETFLSAYRALESFDGTNPKAWLCRIASNKCIDWAKRAGRRSVPTESEYFSEIAAPESTEENYLDKEVRRRLFLCCQALKSPYREVALDYYYYELEIGEIVKKTGKNIKTLQTQIYRARGMLKKLYGKEDLSYDRTT